MLARLLLFIILTDTYLVRYIEPLILADPAHSERYARMETPQSAWIVLGGFPSQAGTPFSRMSLGHSLPEESSVSGNDLYDPLSVRARDRRPCGPRMVRPETNAASNSAK